MYITYADFTHGTAVVTVGGNDNVDVFDNTLEGLEEFFTVQLQFKQCTVHFVHKKNGFDTLSNGLTQDSFSLDTYTCECISSVIRDYKPYK